MRRSSARSADHGAWFSTGRFRGAGRTSRARTGERALRSYGGLVAALHKAGVPIVAGTDGTGLELVRELELYVEAGFTTSEALAARPS